MAEDMVERVARVLYPECWEFINFPNQPDGFWEIRQRSALAKATAAIATHEQALADAGMVVVPREPTEAMVEAADSNWHLFMLDNICQETYTTMIAAYAPTPTAEEDNG